MPNQEDDWVTIALEGLKPIVTVQEAIEVLRTSRRNFYRLVSSGKVHAVKAAEAGSGRLLIPRKSLERYLRGLEGDGRAA